ncbi:hypothetical protein PLANPX_4489 [Lacipirellula parvula]|uniref:Uncharacterized protein n=1 Tax=Lacipirellula parvula TaxID=2650471 RepID=A0A5K7XFQ7_9BACT|nr:hypothetical protein PLANPX_4489 [Lacipirellula parvula]
MCISQTIAPGLFQTRRNMRFAAAVVLILTPHDQIAASPPFNPQ